MSFNWIDLVIVLVVGYYVWEGWEDGAMRLSAGLVSFLGSLWLAVKFHGQVGSFIANKLGISASWGDVTGYIVTALGAEMILAELAGRLLRRFPAGWGQSKLNRAAGAFLSTANGLLIITFLLLVLMALPLRGTIKDDIKVSRIGKTMVVLAERYGGEVKSSLDRAAKEAAVFLTVKPASDERVELDFLDPACTYKEDPQAEARMLELVNSERKQVGAKQLSVDLAIVPVARAHSRDMFERKYFAHQNPEGKNVGDRMQEGKVKFTLAGENLAFAPDVETAHTGLMDSPGHKRNILEPEFGRIGIGVINGGECGMMFTQNFAD